MSEAKNLSAEGTEEASLHWQQDICDPPDSAMPPSEPENSKKARFSQAGLAHAESSKYAVISNLPKCESEQATQLQSPFPLLEGEQLEKLRLRFARCGMQGSAGDGWAAIAFRPFLTCWVFFSCELIGNAIVAFTFLAGRPNDFWTAHLPVYVLLVDVAVLLVPMYWYGPASVHTRRHAVCFTVMVICLTGLLLPHFFKAEEHVPFESNFLFSVLFFVFEVFSMMGNMTGLNKQDILSHIPSFKKLLWRACSRSARFCDSFTDVSFSRMLIDLSRHDRVRSRHGRQPPV